MSNKSVPEEVSSKIVLQECQVRVSYKSVIQECQVRMSSKKGVLQECHLSVSRQGVPQVGSLENVISIVSVLQHTCRHSGSWASSCLVVCGNRQPVNRHWGIFFTSRSVPLDDREMNWTKKGRDWNMWDVGGGTDREQPVLAFEFYVSCFFGSKFEVCR